MSGMRAFRSCFKNGEESEGASVSEKQSESGGKNESGVNIAFALFLRSHFLCPGLDSNQHALSSTTTSKWLVYQFQHLGR